MDIACDQTNTVKPGSEVVGVGSLEGWTKENFLHEFKQLREVVCTKGKSVKERLDAIANATSMILMCGDDDFVENILGPMIEEMRSRDQMISLMLYRSMFGS
ncbi:hypothetical protein D3C87_820640 [compost metagenome]